MGLVEGFGFALGLGALTIIEVLLILRAFDSLGPLVDSAYYTHNITAMLIVGLPLKLIASSFLREPYD